MTAASTSLLALCLAAVLMPGCSRDEPTRSAAPALASAVDYPSSAAYDEQRRTLFVGSYSSGSIEPIAIGAGASSLHALPQDGRTDVLRIRIDEARQRIWVLSSKGLDVYDANRSQLLRRIAVEAVSQHSEDHCFPDVALDAHGNAFVSSATQTRLARVDAESFDVTQQELQLDSDRMLDFGFSAIVFSRTSDRLYAASATNGTLWEIDTARNEARKLPISQPVLGACALHTALKAGAPGEVLYVARGFRDGVARIELSQTAGPYRVDMVLTQRPLVAPTDFVSVGSSLLAVVSQLSQHRDFRGDGGARPPFRIEFVGRS
jgi:hypothetical protein